MDTNPQAIVLMGVSGSGKTSVGVRLSQRLNWPFYDGDDFHPPENIAKMGQGIPLDDADRVPWLAILNNLISEHLSAGKSMLLACSALKRKYRDQLTDGNPGTVFVYLKGDFNLIFDRMGVRSGHYMKAEMLQSQFSALENPKDALVVDISQDLDGITKEIISHIDLK
jgi:gluconokinase